jgi:Tfp pilus assembly PilM family ATPase
MATFPSDVLLIEPRGILHTRFQRGHKETELTAISRTPLPEGTFGPGAVSPSVTAPAALTAALSRIGANRKKSEVAILLPDSWFRLHILPMDSIPDRRADADEMVRWSLRRSLPGRPDDLRLQWETVERSGGGGRVVVLASSEATVASIEAAARAAGMNPVVIEPLGLNLWNALVQGIAEDDAERLLVMSREGDMAMAMFRGSRPVFYRSKRLGAAHDLLQEIRLSASYLRNQAGLGTVAQCWVAGDVVDEDLVSVIEREFGRAPSKLRLSDVGLRLGAIDVGGEETAVAACKGVFAA